MKKILCILLIMSCVISNAQSLSDLDARRGIKDFTLGDPYSKWTDNVEYVENKGDKTLYHYTGDCCSTLFGYDVRKIMLVFSQGKLTRIFFVTMPFQTYKETSNKFVQWRSDDFENINAHIVKMFGEKSDWNINKETGEVNYSWYGRKVSLTSQYVYNGLRKGDYQILMMYLNKKEDF